MQVVFRVDASVDIGSGHVMRCLSLADALSESGAECRFVCRDLPGNLASRIVARGYSAELLPLALPYKLPKADDDYAGWLQVAEEQDAANFLANLTSTDGCVIVDHYALAAAWEQRVNEFCSRLVVVDDLCRQHHVDILVDQTLGRSVADYRNGKINHVLAGSQYALLNKDFYPLRERRELVEEPATHRLIVTLGGIDQPNATLTIVRALAGMQLPWLERIDVVLPPTAPHYAEVKHALADFGPPFVHHDFVTDMASLVAASTLAIGAAGTSTWERASLGVPAVLIPLATNQKGIAAAMIAANAAIVLERHQIDAMLCDALSELRGNWGRYVAANLLVCDGLGSRRVAQRILPALARDGGSVWLESATDNDIETVYGWQKHPETRRFARNPEPPEWQEHLQWMQQQLVNPGCFFYILQHAHQAAGVIRLDRLGPAVYEVSVFIAPEKKRLGLASTGLRLAGNLHRECELRATVLPENKASQRLFESADYQLVSATEFVLLPRET